jgi:hypothetical protein
MCHNFVDPDCRRKKGDPFGQHLKPKRAHLGQTNVKENNLAKNSNNNKRASKAEETSFEESITNSQGIRV